jgi:acyl carrier protein
VIPLTAEQIRGFILDRFRSQLEAKGLSPWTISDDFDLLTEGVVDSMGIVELITALEQHWDIELDLEALEPEKLTIVGPLCRYVEERSRVIADLSFRA